jgi:hypothetical protein
MGPLIGHAFQQLTSLTRVSRKGFEKVTICDLDHIVSVRDMLLAMVFGTITAGQAAC